MVEWDIISAFDSSKVTPSNPYSNVLDDPLVSSQVVPTTKYKIYGLKIGVRYYVRVSVFNNEGYSEAISSNPASAIPPMMLLYELLSVFLSTSKFQTAYRLYVEWSLPSLDRAGFNTDLNTCGSYFKKKLENLF